MEKTVNVKTLLAFVSVIGIPVLIFMYTLSIKSDRNEIRSTNNELSIQRMYNTQTESRTENNENFNRVLDKLHEIDLKLKDKANRK